MDNQHITFRPKRRTINRNRKCDCKCCKICKMRRSKRAYYEANAEHIRAASAAAKKRRLGLLPDLPPLIIDRSDADLDAMALQWLEANVYAVSTN